MAVVAIFRGFSSDLAPRDFFLGAFRVSVFRPTELLKISRPVWSMMLVSKEASIGFSLSPKGPSTS